MHDFDIDGHSWRTGPLAPAVADLANAERVRRGLETLGLAPRKGTSGGPGTGGTTGPADGCDVEIRGWGEGTGPLLYTATLTAKNGRKVNGMGYTPEGAEEDAMQGWMRGEG